MTLENFEKLIINKYKDDKDFAVFLKENPKFSLELERETDSNLEIEYQDDEVLREMVVGYLEEINLSERIEDNDIEELLKKISKEEIKEKFVLNALFDAAKIALYFLREGIEYLELVQEGVVGAVKGIENYTFEIGDLKNYMLLWIGKEMVLYVEDKFQQTKHEFLYYLTKTDLEEMELTADEKDEKIKIIKNKKLEDVYFKLSDKEIKILQLYFGFGVEKRFSILEIENKLDLLNGSGEEIFYKALNKISSMGGRMFTV